MIAAFAHPSTTTGDRAIALRSLFPLVDADATQVWIHVAYEGTWEGHPSGAFTLNRAAFDEIVANFDAQKNPIPLDWEHSTEWAAEAPAAGWVQQLAVRMGDDGGAHLWALAELTPKAATQIRDGAYRFSSGVFVFDATDRVTGDECGCLMHSLALTNTPFIDGQEPIRLSLRAALAAKGPDMQIPKDELIAKLQELEADELSPEAIAKLAEALALLAEAAADEPAEEDAPADEAEAAAPEPPMAAPASDEPADAVQASDEPADVVEAAHPVATAEPPADGEAPADEAASSDAAAMALSMLMQDTGLDEAGVLAALEANRDAVAAALAGGASEEPAPLSDDTALSDRVTTLAADVDARDAIIRDLRAKLSTFEAAESAKLDEQADAEVEDLVASGVLATSQRDWARGKARLALSDTTARADWDNVKSLLRPVAPTGRHASASSAIGAGSTAAPDVADDDPDLRIYRLGLKGTFTRDPETGRRRLRNDAEIDQLAREAIHAARSRAN